MSPAPGSLDGREVTLERDDVGLGRGTLSDTRQQTYHDIPTAGGNTTRKPGRITGDVVIEISEVADEQLADELRRRASRERVLQPKSFDVVLDDGVVLAGWSIATSWGGRRFSLSGI